MKDLTVESKTFPGGPIVLALHVKTSSGLTHLRWRARTSGDHKHVNWDKVQEVLKEAGFSESVRARYADWSRRALELNADHREQRREIATARKVVLRSTPHVFARPIPLV